MSRSNNRRPALAKNWRPHSNSEHGGNPDENPEATRGFCIWFTGLSGSGKSTLAAGLVARLEELGRVVTLLDGDVVRTHISKGLGFSKEDRDTNILRIGFVASEIVRHRGAVICGAISPYRETRERVRQLIGPDDFVLAFVDAPLEVCEQRDVKGMYAKARRGEIKGFTGIDDPYEPPFDADIVLATGACRPEQNVQQIVDYLVEHGYLRDRRETKAIGAAQRGREGKVHG